MKTSTIALTRYLGRRSAHGLAVLADLASAGDLPQPRPPGTAMGVFCVRCGKEQVRAVCSSCSSLGKDRSTGP